MVISDSSEARLNGHVGDVDRLAEAQQMGRYKLADILVGGKQLLDPIGEGDRRGDEIGRVEVIFPSCAANSAVRTRSIGTGGRNGIVPAPAHETSGRNL